MQHITPRKKQFLESFGIYLTEQSVESTVHVKTLSFLLIVLESLYQHPLNYDQLDKHDLARLRHIVHTHPKYAQHKASFSQTLALANEWIDSGDKKPKQSFSKLIPTVSLSPLFPKYAATACILLVLGVAVAQIGISLFTNTNIAYSESSISESILSSIAKEATVQGSTQSLQQFGTAAAFGDKTYASLRLENFASLSDEGVWDGPDFLVAQSNGRGVFYLQAGGNVFMAGGVNALTGLFRDDVTINGSLSIGGTTTFNNLSVRGTLSAQAVDVSDATIEDLTVSGAFNLGSSALPWASVAKSGSSIRDLADVSITNPTNNQTLMWDSATSTWKNQAPSSATSRDEADYIVSMNGSTCEVYSADSGSISSSSTNHATCITSAINAAGEIGVLAFQSGNYSIDTQLTPKYRQTWHMNKGAVFSPTGNNRILNIASVDEFNLYGTLMIVDTNANSTSVEAVRIEDVAHTYFEHIFIRNYYRGISMTGTAGGTHENTFVDLYMQVRDRGLSLETSSHDNHFLHVWIKGPSPTSWATGPGLYMATSGTQGGNTFDNIEILDTNIGMDLPGSFETWFGKVLIDNPLAQGIVMGGSVERLFFDTIWTASGGDGIVLSGNATSPVDKIQIDRLYSWLNGNYGVRFESYVEQVTIGQMVVQRNDKGLAFNGIENKDISINSLTSFENTTFGVDGSGITENVYVNNAMIYDTVLGLDQFSNIVGTRPGTGAFQARGIAKVLSGQSSIVVTHGLEGTPTNIALSPYHSEVAGAYISARTSSTFTITASGAVTADREIGWEARSGRQLDDELLANPNVELGTTTPTAWNKSVSNTTWSTAEARSGTQSLQINVAGATGDWRSDVVPVTANYTYRLRAFVNGTGSAQLFVTVRWFSDVGGSSFISENNITLNSTYSDWTQVTSDINAPATAQSADIMFRAGSSTTANLYADDFSLRKIH